MNFIEKQRFNQWWLWALLLGIGLIPFYGIYQQIILGIPYGDNPMSDIGLIFFAIFMTCFNAFFRIMYLETVIDKKGIRMVFYPFVKKRITWDEVYSASVVKYGFAGYGIRISGKHNIIYNIRGNKGLAIKLKSGGRFLIGTQKPEELNQTIKRHGII